MMCASTSRTSSASTSRSTRNCRTWSSSWPTKPWRRGSRSPASRECRFASRSRQINRPTVSPRKLILSQSSTWLPCCPLATRARPSKSGTPVTGRSLGLIRTTRCRRDSWKHSAGNRARRRRTVITSKPSRIRIRFKSAIVSYSDPNLKIYRMSLTDFWLHWLDVTKRKWRSHNCRPLLNTF